MMNKEERIRKEIEEEWAYLSKAFDEEWEKYDEVPHQQRDVTIEAEEETDNGKK